MTITVDSGRQYELSTDFLTVSYADLIISATQPSLDGVATPVFELPAGSVVTGGEIIVDTAFDSTTSDALDLGDDVDVNRYLAAVDLTSTGRTAFVAANLGYEYTAPNTVDVIHTAGTADTATAGSFRLRLTYVIDGRTNENQG